jgi:beta-lactamase superfamily II metal-dependent hydrolase
MLIAIAAWANPLPASRNSLQIYFVDVEGGQATLFVTPEGQSLLIDTGWPGHDGRDADRIVAAAKKAGLSKIDYVLITHFHEDHVGGAPQLAERIPVGTFIDHGDNRETSDGPTNQVWHSYQELLASKKTKRVSVKPGDVLPIAGMRALIVSSDGSVIGKPVIGKPVIDKPMTGAGSGAGRDNPACRNAESFPADQTENARSLGTLITFGKLTILDLGDLTRDKEMQLMCPVNKLGKVDIYIVSHHGWVQSSSPALVYGIDSRVAIMDNGAKKGGTPATWDIIRKSPHLEDLWQLHFSEEGGPAHNAPSEFIANPDGPDAAHYLLLTALPDGRFDVFNSRTKRTKHYPAR